MCLLYVSDVWAVCRKWTSESDCFISVLDDLRFGIGLVVRRDFVLILHLPVRRLWGDAAEGEQTVVVHASGLCGLRYAIRVVL